MSRSLSEDRESHDRLLDKEYRQDDEGECWRDDGQSHLRYKKSNFKAAIGITSLAFNVFLALLCIWLWLRSRSPLPPWPNTLYCEFCHTKRSSCIDNVPVAPAQDAVEYEIVTFNSDFPEDQ